MTDLTARRLVLGVTLLFWIILVSMATGCTTVQKAPDCAVCDKCPSTMVRADDFCEGAADRLEDALRMSEASRASCEASYARSLRKGW